MITFSHGIKKKFPLMRTVLEDDFAFQESVLGWGNKTNTARARDYAHKSNLLYLSLEDGFLRSMGLGVDGDEPLSLVVDDYGIYYDATKPSKLEKLILDDAGIAPLLSDGAEALSLVVGNKLSKYNHVAEGWPSHLHMDTAKKQVLVIDQTFGDMSLKYGGVTLETFTEMMQSAQVENPGAELWVKIHPDVLTGKKQGHLTDFLQAEGVHLLSENIHPLSLLEKMDKVYVATSQMGFEALMLGKEVVTFGLPWYAGWGLTDDRHAGIAALKYAGRRREATLLELFTAAYLQYCRYLNPYTQEKGDIFDVIRYLVMMKNKADYLQGTIVCIGLSWWKRKIIQPFLQTHNNQVLFFRNLSGCQKASLPENSRLLLWGKKDLASQNWAEQQGMAVLRMEDGFIRSVGLGSNLIPPLSLVVDDIGIYFDAKSPSRLEWMLQNHEFTAEERKQARDLKAALIENKIGKYNVGNGGFHLPIPRPELVILIPGQVEDDASIAFGTNDIKTNLGLIQSVRKNNPDAYLIYKPHPDVVSGNRVGGVNENEALEYVNEVVTQADILMCIESADEVHTMTSLSGFEALLRDKKVVCYGAPFYSGWGLTEDKYQIKRRNKKLMLDELIAGTMLLYPIYLDPKTGKDIDAMTALSILSTQKQQKQQTIHSSYFFRKYNQLGSILSVLKYSKNK